ncbi:hypothetical protein BT96DRAFT_937307 [Gymnopus androsaceus JB14]|uniref:Uncharacterized protein n=1 Tax=Gymnopus androsaceus JB14 TaxID=1447944 RepID=A0A6A4HT46_9AGAR|nr:hypothetical protein BT96DRAFT_937307 [Gymnopus androsaceus JB14]
MCGAQSTLKIWLQGSKVIPYLVAIFISTYYYETPTIILKTENCTAVQLLHWCNVFLSALQFSAVQLAVFKWLMNCTFKPYISSTEQHDASEEAEYYRQLEEGYKSEDSLEGDEDEEEDEDNGPLDLGFSHHTTPSNDLLDLNLYNISNEEVTFEYWDLIDGSLPDLTDSEDNTLPSLPTHTSIPNSLPFPMPPASSTTIKPINTKWKATTKQYGGWKRERVFRKLCYIDWDGESNLVFCDHQGLGLVHCIGRPRDPNWMPDINKEAAWVLDKARVNLKLSAKQANNQQGEFTAIAIGYSHGGGQMEPSNSKHCKKNLKVLKSLLANPAVQHLSGIANSAYKCFCPGILCKNFRNMVFAATTFNLGPWTTTDDHVDHANYAPGGCAISCVGAFNNHHGGELVLWNLRIILHFPAATTIIINSALICHLNLPIQAGEQRYPITQYSAGALFRFRYNGSQNDKDCLAHATPKEKEQWVKENT